MSISAQSALTNLQNNTTKTQFEQGQKRLGSSNLTREGFLQIIMAQMQYQDPTEPQDYSQMLGQQVQLEVADKMGSLVDATKFSQAANMIGKTATLTDAQWDFENGVSANPEWDYKTNTAKSVTGTIQSIQFDKTHNKAVVQINGRYYDADGIQNLTMGSTPATPTPTPATGNTSS